MFVWSSLEISTSTYSVIAIIWTAMFLAVCGGFARHLVPLDFSFLSLLFLCVMSCNYPLYFVHFLCYRKLANNFWNFHSITGIFRIYSSLI